MKLENNSVNRYKAEGKSFIPCAVDGLPENINRYLKNDERKLIGVQFKSIKKRRQYGFYVIFVFDNLG